MEGSCNQSNVGNLLKSSKTVTSTKVSYDSCQ